MSSTSRLSIIESGKIAFEQEKSLSMNPWYENSNEWFWWRRGWYHEAHKPGKCGRRPGESEPTMICYDIKEERRGREDELRNVSVIMTISGSHLPYGGVTIRLGAINGDLLPLDYERGIFEKTDGEYVTFSLLLDRLEIPNREREGLIETFKLDFPDLVKANKL